MGWTFAVGSVSFGILDIVSFALFIIVGIVSSYKGISTVASRVLAWTLCFPFALLFTLFLSKFLQPRMNINLLLSSLISFTLLSMIIFLFFVIIGSLLRKALIVTHLSFIDSVLGFIFGILLTVVFITLLVAILSLNLPFISFKELLNSSYLYKNVYFRLFPSFKEIAKEALSAI